MEEKILAYHFLNEVKKDAIEKSRGQDVTEQVYSAMMQMMKLAELARKEGLLALDMELEEGRLDSITVIPKWIDYLCNGMKPGELAEILTSMYWVKNPQGMESLAYYVCILAIVKIQECVPIYELEVFLTALLPEECAAEYERRREERLPKQAEKTRLEILLEKEIDLPKRSIVIRYALEEKLEAAKESDIKAAIRKLEEDKKIYFPIVIRGLSIAYKKKLLFSLSPVHRAAVLEDEEYIGPIRTVDIEDAFVGFLEYIEAAEHLMP